QAAGAVFRALGLHASSEYQRAWPTILSLERLEDVDALLKPVGAQQGRRGSARPAATEESEATISASSSSSGPRQLRNLPSAGPQILAMLLRFPAEVVAPLLTGLQKVLSNSELLGALAREARTARVLEAALAPSSALSAPLRLKTARAFKGTLGALGPHHVGGWVAAAVWRASLGETALRAAFAEELLAVEEDLRAKNFAVWKVCGLHQAKVRQEEWSQQQSKAGKTQRLFEGLLEGGDAEAAKAAAAARTRAEDDRAMAKAAAEAAVLADPTVAALLAFSAPEGDGADEPEEEEDTAEVDKLLATAKPWELRKRKKRRAAAAAEPSEPQPEAPAATAKAEGGDKDLAAALELIRGRAPAKVRKQQKKREAAAEAAASEDDSPENAPVKKKAKTGKRPNFTY
ncbi:unnamed protein product, partial [Polarella glacialis]